MFLGTAKVCKTHLNANIHGVCGGGFVAVALDKVQGVSQLFGLIVNVPSIYVGTYQYT